MKQAVWVASVVILVAVPLFFFAPIVHSPILVWDCASVYQNPSLCRTSIDGYESPSCSLVGVGAGTDGRTLSGQGKVVNGTLYPEYQKPWSYYLGCSPKSIASGARA